MAAIVHLVDAPSDRGSTRILLDDQGDATRVRAIGAERLQEALREHGYVLLDMRSREIPGHQLLEELTSCGAAIPVIVVTECDDTTIAVQAMRLGAVDFLHGPCEERDLIAAIERAMAMLGAGDVRAEARTTAIERLQQLSRREIQVLCGMMAGMTNKHIARRLGISPRTVEMHRASMMADLGAGSAAEAIRIGLDADLPPLGQEGNDETVGIAVARAPDRQEGRVGVTPEPGLPAVTDVLDGSSDCVLIVDGRFNVTYMNRNARGASADGAAQLGCHLWTAFPWCRDASARQQLEQSQAERVAACFELHATSLGRWFAVNTQPVPNGLLLWFRDRTLDRAADVAIRQNEERLRYALEASGDGAWDWNVAQGLVHMSRRFLDRLGYGDAHSAAGATQLWRLVHPDDRARLKAGLKDQLAGTSEGFLCEYRIRTREGEWRWNLDRGRVVSRDPVSGAALRMVASSTDISAIKAMNEPVAAAHARLRLALEASDAGYWDCDPDLSRIRLCARSREMHGLPAQGSDELEMHAWRDSLHPRDVAPTLQALDAAARSGQAFSASYRAIRPGGEVRRILAVGRFARCGDAPSRIFGLNIDLTEQERADSTARRRPAQLEHRPRLTEIAAIASALADELNGMALGVAPPRPVRRSLIAPGGEAPNARGAAGRARRS